MPSRLEQGGVVILMQRTSRSVVVRGLTACGTKEWQACGDVKEA